MNNYNQQKAEEFRDVRTNQVVQQKCSFVGSPQIRSSSVQDGEVGVTVKGKRSHESSLSSLGVTIHSSKQESKK